MMNIQSQVAGPLLSSPFQSGQKRSRSELISQTGNVGSKKARTDYWGYPEVPGGVARFALRTTDSGRQTIDINMGALRSPYFQPGSNPFGGFPDDQLTRALYSNPLANLRGRIGQQGGGEVGAFPAASFGNIPTIGFHANHTVPGNMTVIYNPMPIYSLPRKKDFVFLRRQTLEERTRLVSTATGHVLDETPRQAFTIPALNHHLAVNQFKPKSIDDILNPKTARDGVDYRDPRSIAQEFYFKGVVSASTTNSGWGSEPYHDLPYGGGADPSDVLKVGFTISGRAEGTPIFGPHLRVNMHCFFVLKPMPLPDAYTVGENASGSVKIRFSEAERAQLHEMPFQFVPMAFESSIPSYAEASYIDDLGFEHLAPYKEAGVVAKELPPGGFRDRRRASHDIEFVRDQGVQEFVIHG